MKKGKLIVIDGIDGSGKKTQTQLLVRRLKKLKKKVVEFSFPEYYRNFFGQNIKKFLTQEEFLFLKTHPKVASLWYAADRWEAKEKIEKFLKQGYFVIIDRYVTANQIHQGAKFDYTDDGEFKRKEFVKWLETLEYKIFKIPRPDIVFYLNLDPYTARKITSTRVNDIADKDLVHQISSRKSALKLAEEVKGIKVIDCDLPNGGIKTRQEISDLIFEKLKKHV
jgi:dTMP kinase